MTTDPKPLPETADAAIETLLTRDETLSIVDGLFALPGDDTGRAGSAEWNRAVQSRLQSRLVERMRQVIETSEDRSASAA